MRKAWQWVGLAALLIPWVLIFALIMAVYSVFNR